MPSTLSVDVGVIDEHPLREPRWHGATPPGGLLRGAHPKKLEKCSSLHFLQSAELCLQILRDARVSLPERPIARPRAPLFSEMRRDSQPPAESGRPAGFEFTESV